MSGSLLASLPPPPQPGAFTFLAGLAAGCAVVVVMMAPILAKGFEVHHHLPPSRRRRRRMILCYWGMAASLLCLAMFALTFTPLTASLPQLLMAIVGMGLSLISMFALSSARDIREPEPLAGQRDAPGRIRIA